MTTSPFVDAFSGRFRGILRWPELDTLWQKVTQQNDWYIYTLAKSPPEVISTAEELSQFISSSDQLLRQELTPDYCGAVYVDNPEEPTFVKIFDPNNMGSACGSSDHVILPGWILSQRKPCDLVAHFTPKPSAPWWKRVSPL
jgi:hypothetical protein